MTYRLLFVPVLENVDEYRDRNSPSCRIGLAIALLEAVYMTDSVKRNDILVRERPRED